MLGKSNIWRQNDMKKPANNTRYSLVLNDLLL